MQVIYRWAFSVAPALCLSVLPPHSKSGGAGAPPGYMASAPLRLAALILQYFSSKLYSSSFSTHVTVLDRAILLSKFCLSVCLSVCLSNACFVSKQNNRLSVYQYHTVDGLF